MRIANTVDDSIVDGPGLRFVVFAQGCNHHCPHCHNPETHDPEGGREASVEQLQLQFGKNPLLEGLTLSGGEPFLQAEDCASLARAAHGVGWTVWVYSGYRYETLAEGKNPSWAKLLEETDVLVDGLFLQEQKSYGLPFRGSANQRLIDVPLSRRAGRAVLWEKRDPLGHFTVPES